MSHLATIHPPEVLRYTAFIPMKEPNPDTGEYPGHVYDCLRLVHALHAAGVVENAVISGGEAEWFKAGGKQTAGTESDEGERYLFEELGFTGEVFKDQLARKSVANLKNSAEKFFFPMREKMENVLTVTAPQRAPRIDLLRGIVIGGRIRNFHFTVAGDAPELYRSEAVALAMQHRYLPGVDWRELDTSDLEGHKLRPFWREFDRVKADLAQAGATPDVLDIISGMREDTLEPGMKAFAMNVARNPVLPNLSELPNFRPAEHLLRAGRAMQNA